MECYWQWLTNFLFLLSDTIFRNSQKVLQGYWPIISQQKMQSAADQYRSIKSTIVEFPNPFLPHSLLHQQLILNLQTNTGSQLTPCNNNHANKHEYASCSLLLSQCSEWCTGDTSGLVVSRLPITAAWFTNRALFALSAVPGLTICCLWDNPYFVF